MVTAGVIGWDIGGVNTKVARVAGGEVLAVRGRPFELQRDPPALTPLLRELACEIDADVDAAHAVTMTAELSQMFRTKRDGVAFVLDAVEAAFRSSAIHVFCVDGRFVRPAHARSHHLDVAAANWSATAHVVAWRHADAVLIDVGTTTTDIIPISASAVVAEGRTDPDRLASGELVYTGALRTPVEAIASHVRLGANTVGVSAEGFAVAGDVHVWRGDLATSDYTVPTPDGRPATREAAGERIARVICADRDMLDETAVSEIASALAGAQVSRIREALGRVLARHPSLRVAVVTGLGAFLGEHAARDAGLEIVPLSNRLGVAAARCAPAAAVGLLLEKRLLEKKGSGLISETAISAGDTGAILSETTPDPFSVPGPLLVVKLGGEVLADDQTFESVLHVIAEVARSRRLLIVPGGGPFADAVRAVDRHIHLSDDAAHWMAILAMDQYACLIESRLAAAVIVSHPQDVAALAAGRVPVLAPSRWLREADPLPHTWDVTSDSIAAWVAGELRASRLVLVKPPLAGGETVAQAGPRADVVDAYFARALPACVTPVIVTADRIDDLEAALRA